MKLTNITTVFFDFDDTLGDREQYAYDCAKAMLKEKIHIDDEMKMETILQDWMLWDEKGNIKKSHVVDHLKEKYNIVYDYQEFDDLWNNTQWKYAVPFADTKETLTYLQKKYQLGLITNGPSEGQRNKLIKAGLDGYFDLDKIVVSGDYPFAKPDVRLFQQACKNYGVRPEQCVYVGDIYPNDVTGRYNAGMTPIWIWTAGNRRQSTHIITIHKLSELKDIL